MPFLMSMSETFSVSFLTLIKFCNTKALEWSSLVPGPEAESSLEIKNLTPFTISHLLQACLGSSGQGKNTQRSSHPAFSYVCFLLYFTNPSVCLCEWMTQIVWSKWWALLWGFEVPHNDWRQLQKESLVRIYTKLPMPKDTQCPCEGSSQRWTKRVDPTFLSRSPFPGFFDHFIIAWGIRTTKLTCQIIDFQWTCDSCCYYVLLLRLHVWKHLAKSYKSMFGSKAEL